MVEYYLSIYFQGVRGYSATKSSLFVLPMAVGLGVAVIGFGAATSRVGYYTPFMYFSTIVASIATGFLTAINLHADIAKLLVILGFFGFAIGVGIQMPQVAAQVILAEVDAVMGSMVVLFASQPGHVLFLSGSSALFTNRMNAEVGYYSPSTNITSLENVGLTSIRQQIGSSKLGDVLLGYNTAVSQTLYLPLALACMTLFGTLAMEWRSVKEKKD